MELDILKLIYDYSMNGKLADSEFINKIIAIIIKERNLNEYICSVIFTNEMFEDNLASYDEIKKVILVCLEGIQTSKAIDALNCMFQGFELIMAKNILITQLILHELEHVYQNKQVFNLSDDSVEAKLLRASIRSYKLMHNEKIYYDGKVSVEELIAHITLQNNLYNKYYLFNPSERLADINSCKTIVNSIQPIEKKYLIINKYVKGLLIAAMLRGYQLHGCQVICPTEVYLSGTGQNKIWSEFDFYDYNSSKLMEKVSKQYSLYKRLTLGLPVTNEEYGMFKKC